MNSDNVVFDPQAVSDAALTAIKERTETRDDGITTGIRAIDKKLNAQRRGELRIVLGYTSNYKTGFISYVARRAARRFMDAGGERVVISVTWEQSIEEQGVIDLAQLSRLDATKLMRGECEDTDWQKLRRSAVERGTLPWWLFGHSSEKKERRPRLSMTDIARALEYIVDVQKLDVGLITLDYLQRIRREKSDGDTMREQFMNIVDRSKDMALAFGVPVMLGTQAGREVKRRVWRLPQVEDGQETSNLEQSADSIISVWMPNKDYPVGHVVEYGDFRVTVAQNSLVLGIMKQKFGPAPELVNLMVKPEINEIYEVAI